MFTLSIFDLAARQAAWLGVRLNTISENIANSDTPGYRARDITPFADVLDDGNMQMAVTSPLHIGEDPARSTAARVRESRSEDASLSGNSVSVDQQFVKANEIRNAYGLNTAIVKAFNRMISDGLKS